MKLSIILLLFILGLGIEESVGQTVSLSGGKKNHAISLEGMLGFSIGKDFYSMNVGGPALLINLNSDLRIGLGAFPSLYIEWKSWGSVGGIPQNRL